MDNKAIYVWVFNGSSSRFPSGIFSSKARAESWILTNRLSGILTRYPLDEGVLDWAIKQGLFSPKKSSEREPAFIQKFTSGSQEHYHYEDGKLD
jgi:hypothetical protein